MIKFVNAKINIGLNVVKKREDGYHDLETVFFPVGLENGLPHQPEPFDDILEITNNPAEVSGCRFQLMGRRIDCEPQKNLVIKASTLFFKAYSERHEDIGNFGLFEIILDKHLPDGAGLGGGSADASFTLLTLNEIMNYPFTPGELSEMALRLGADCPFFIYNEPCFAEGIGEKLTPVDIDLKGRTLLIIKPDVKISTADAFGGIKPRKPLFDLRFISHLPLEKWRGNVVNDFEETIFPKFPELGEIKAMLYNHGAVYASMSGSGSALYGIFEDKERAEQTRIHAQSNYNDVWLFGL